MRFTFTEEQEAFRQELREFCQKEMTEEILDQALDNTHIPEIYKKVAERGWFGLAWPKEYGGQGKGHIDMAIFGDEMGYGRVPLTAYGTTVVFVAQSIMHYGSEEDKRFFLPKIGRGEMICSWGLTEPNAGSDAASVATRADEDGDDYVINGNKIFTTNAHIADYVLLVTRTNQQAPKHRGISIFIVDMKSPGISLRPLYTLGGGRVNEVFFDNVRVPKTRMMGEKDLGWYNAARTLDLERSGAGRVGGMRRDFEELVEFARTHTRAGDLISRSQVWQHKLADMATQMEVCRMLSYRVAWMQQNGITPNKEASMIKLFGSTLSQDLARLGMKLLGVYSQLELGSKWARLRGRMVRAYKATVLSTIGGGSNEIQKNIIASRGLGLPR